MKSVDFNAVLLFSRVVDKFIAVYHHRNELLLVALAHEVHEYRPYQAEQRLQKTTTTTTKNKETYHSFSCWFKIWFLLCLSKKKLTVIYYLFFYILLINSEVNHLISWVFFFCKFHLFLFLYYFNL